MALIKFWGAETGHLNEFNGTVQGGVSIDTTVSSNTGGARSFKQSGANLTNSTFAGNLSIATSSTPIYSTFRFRVVSATTPAEIRYWRHIVFFDPAVNYLFAVTSAHDTLGRFYVQIESSIGGGTVHCQQEITGWTSGDWLEIGAEFSNAGCALIINGTRYTGTACISGTPTIGSISGLSVTSTSNVADTNRPFWLDDICLWDAIPSPAVGIPSVIARQFSANSSVNNAWATLIGGATKFGNVSETPFSATNAISSATNGAAQLFIPNSFSSTETGKGSGTINATTGYVLGSRIAAVMKTSATSSGGANISLRRRIGGVNTDYSITTLTTTDAYYDTMRLVASGNVVLTISELNAGEFGVVHGASTRTQTLEDLWVVVAYSPNDRFVNTAGAGSYTMTGTAAGVKKGRKVLAGVGSYSMTGTAAGVKPGKRLIAGVGSYSMTGTAAGVLKNDKLPAAAGSYSMTGTAAGVEWNRKLAAAIGSYSLTGSAAAIKRGIKLLADGGVYSMSGSLAGVLHGWKLPAAAGSYVLTGSDATISKAAPPKTVVADSGTYAMTGTAAGVLHGWKIAAGSSSYAMTGAAAGVKHGWKLPAGVGSYSMTGQTAALRRGLKLPAAAGSYSMTGQIAGLKHAWKLAAAPSSYSMLGSAAAIKHGWSVVAGDGTYALTGTDATIQKPTGKFLTAAPGTYALTGSTAGVVRTWKVLAGTASYDMVGAPASFAIEKPAVKPGMSVGSGGDMPPVHRQRDTRWDGVREAREEARRLFDKVPATPAKARKQAAVRASEAVAKVAKAVKPTRATELAFDPALDRLLELQAYLQGLIDQQEAIKAAQAREAAEMWAMIERELILEAQREEELMIVMALAL